MSFNPNQPRVPAGSPDGGQFASSEGIVFDSMRPADVVRDVRKIISKIDPSIKLSLRSNPNSDSYGIVASRGADRHDSYVDSKDATSSEGVSKAFKPLLSRLGVGLSVSSNYGDNVKLKATMGVVPKSLSMQQFKAAMKPRMSVKERDSLDKDLRNRGVQSIGSSTNARGGVKFAQRMDAAFEYSKRKP